ncbi:MAG TPA: hypothetical protein VH501_04250 [Solirubrobacterales bacterium]|jgi:hypothetical protein
MFRNGPRRPSAALIVASLALFIALGGVGYAALGIPKGSITARHLAKNSVGKSEIAKNAVRSPELANGAVKPADLAAGAVPIAYAAYLQPHADTSSIGVGWATDTQPAPTLTYLGPGRYRVEFTSPNGVGCAVPAVLPVSGAAGVTFRVVGLGCSAEATSFQIETSNGQDNQFMLQVAFTPL